MSHFGCVPYIVLGNSFYLYLVHGHLLVIPVRNKLYWFVCAEYLLDRVFATATNRSCQEKFFILSRTIRMAKHIFFLLKVCNVKKSTFRIVNSFVEKSCLRSDRRLTAVNLATLGRNQSQSRKDNRSFVLKTTWYPKGMTSSNRK